MQRGRRIVEKGAGLGRHASATGGDKLHRQGRRLERPQQPHKAACSHILRRLVGEDARDAPPGADGQELGLDVIDAKPWREPHHRRTLARAEAPFERPGRRRAEDRGMGRKLGRLRRRAMAGDIGGTRHQYPPHLAEAADQQGRIGERADPHRDIEPFLNEIEMAVVEYELDRGLGIGIQEAAHHRRDVAAPELHRGGDADEATDGRGRGSADRRVVIGDEATRLLRQDAPGLGRREPARGSLDEAQPDPSLERGERARQGRRRAPELVRRPRQTALVENGDEGAEFVQPIHSSNLWNYNFHIHGVFVSWRNDYVTGIIAIETLMDSFPFNADERAAQRRAGGGPSAAGIRPSMPDQHRGFFAQLPYLFVTTSDAAGWPLATVLTGAAGFVASPDPETLRIEALPGHGDPAAPGFAAGQALGLLGIDFATRRRNRANGTIRDRDGNGFTVAVRESFGNCAKYIQRRTVHGAPAAALTTGTTAETLTALDAAARQLVASADTLFIASRARAGREPGGADMSHRGGQPGFVQVEGDRLTIPDFAGNRYFNTFGNLLGEPRASLLFLDFDLGDVLQLQGVAAIDWQAQAAVAIAGAERIWRFRVERGWRRRGVLPLRWSFVDFSPMTLLTGTSGGAVGATGA